MYEIKALHCGKCFVLFLSLIGMFAFYEVQFITACIFWFSQKSSYSQGGSRYKQRVFLNAIDIFALAPDVFMLFGNLACLTDNCLLGLVRTCLIN